MKLRLFAVLALLSLLPIGAFGGAVQTAVAQMPDAVTTPVLPVTVQDVDGNDVTVTDVSRVIPLNGNVTETLFALGLGGNVVATDISALYPQAAVDLPKIGYQRQLSAESILSYEPTLIIGTEDAGPPEVIEQVRGAGVTVLILPVSKTTDGAVAEIEAIGAAVGLPDAATGLAEGVSTTIAEAQTLSAGIEPKARVAFLYLRGQGTQLLAGAGSEADAVITAAGAINVGAELHIQQYQPITPEALVAAAPDIILVMQLGLESVGGLEGLMQIPGVGQTPAGQSGHIIAFEDLYLLGFGPRLGDAIYDLTLALYPQLAGTPKHPEWQGTEPVEATPAA